MQYSYYYPEGTMNDIDNIPTRNLQVIHYWHRYAEEVKKAAGRRSGPLTARFIQNSHILGQVSAGLVERMRTHLANAALRPFAIEDRNAGYVGSHYRPPIFGPNFVKEFNEHSDHFDLSEEILWTIGDILEEMKDSVADCIGTPWRTCNVRIFRTPCPSPVPAGLEPPVYWGYQWHTDGFVPEIYKILFYFEPMNRENGAISFRFNGEEHMVTSEHPGLWVLLKPSEIMHKGLMPEKPGRARLTMEVTLIPSAFFATAPVWAGPNAHYPAFPWTRISPFFEGYAPSSPASP